MLLQGILFTVRLDNIDFGRICLGIREIESEKTAHVGRITKIAHCIWIVFGLPYNYKPNLSLKMIRKPFKPSRSVSTKSVAWQFHDTNRESHCRTRHTQIRTLYWHLMTLLVPGLGKRQMHFCQLWRGRKNILHAGLVVFNLTLSLPRMT